MARKGQARRVERRPAATPAVFISGTTKDLAAARRHVAAVVKRAGLNPVVENLFETVPHNVDLADWVSLKLRDCAAVIHLAGLHYGGDARLRNKGSTQVSWTQMEYELARKLDVPLLVCLADEGNYAKARYEESGSAQEKQRKRHSQREHYDRIKKGRRIFYPFRKPKDLDADLKNFLRPIKAAPARKELTILFVGAERGTGLDLRGQLRQTRKVMPRKGRARIVGLFDPTLAQVIKTIDNKKPTIVHFSGKQEGGLIKLHNDKGKLIPFDADSLAHTLATTRNAALKLVVLDTCYNMRQARLLVKNGVRHAVGIHHAIFENVATGYFANFYSLLASGKNLHLAAETAHHITVGALKDPETLRELEVELEEKFNPKYHIPQVASRRGLDPRHETFL